MLPSPSRPGPGLSLIYYLVQLPLAADKVRQREQVRAVCVADLLDQLRIRQPPHFKSPHILPGIGQARPWQFKAAHDLRPRDVAK